MSGAEKNEVKEKKSARLVMASVASKGVSMISEYDRNAMGADQPAPTVTTPGKKDSLIVMRKRMLEKDGPQEEGINKQAVAAVVITIGLAIIMITYIAAATACGCPRDYSSGRTGRAPYGARRLSGNGRDVAV
ncbi:uncharacterized protein LOC144144857 [Haemaphysalis longicornis]